jgi:2-oxoglutarate ferredoxin oxidoreductase subunit beta
MGDGLDTMKYYKAASKIRNGASTSEVPLSKQGEIIVGKFVDRERPDYYEMMRNQHKLKLASRYAEPETICS